MEFHKILVPVVGTEADEEAMKLACRLAKKDKGKVWSVYVVTIKRALPLDAEIESGKQFGYWSRILGIRLLGLSDIDPEDINNMPTNIGQQQKLLDELNELISKSQDKEKTIKWILDTYKAKEIDQLNEDRLKQVISIIKQKANK